MSMDDDEFQMELNDMKSKLGDIQRTGTDLGERDLSDEQRAQLDEFMSEIGCPP